MTDVLTEFSRALGARAQSAAPLVAAIRLSKGRSLSGSLWRPDLIVASEQSLPRLDEYEIGVPGGTSGKARLVGRDPGTNIALLKLEAPAPLPSVSAAEARLGALVIAAGSGAAGPTVRLGIVAEAGPAWRSRAGGLIDGRVVLDLSLSRGEEGGPVLDAEGARLGFTALGPRRRVLVIPSATVERVIPQLLERGYVPRGWLGAALQPVAVPDSLQAEAGHKSGLMVMSLAPDGPCAKAGVLGGDILLLLDGEPLRRLRRSLGADSIGREAELKLARGGAILSLKLRITERPRE